MPFPFYPGRITIRRLSYWMCVLGVFREMYSIVGCPYLHDERLSEYSAFPLNIVARRHNSNALLTLWTPQLDKIIGFCRVYVAYDAGTVTML